MSTDQLSWYDAYWFCRTEHDPEGGLFTPDTEDKHQSGANIMGTHLKGEAVWTSILKDRWYFIGPNGDIGNV